MNLENVGVCSSEKMTDGVSGEAMCNIPSIKHNQC